MWQLHFKVTFTNIFSSSEKQQKHNCCKLIQTSASFKSLTVVTNVVLLCTTSNKVTHSLLYGDIKFCGNVALITWCRYPVCWNMGRCPVSLAVLRSKLFVIWFPFSELLAQWSSGRRQLQPRVRCIKLDSWLVLYVRTHSFSQIWKSRENKSSSFINVCHCKTWFSLPFFSHRCTQTLP